MFSTLKQNIIDRPATKIVTELNMATGQSLMHSFAEHACTSIIPRNELFYQSIYINQVQDFLVYMTDGQRIQALLGHRAT